MKELRGKVAVVTGAASGVGRALARRAVAEGMSVVAADVEQAELAVTKAELKSEGAPVVSVPADVSRVEDVERVARTALDEFGAVHLLFNNAGVGIVGPPVWESTLSDWEWVLGVDLWGLIHGLRVFVPIMLRQATPCHVVNTASAAGLFSVPGMATYNVAKRGVVTLSETLQFELSRENAAIKVSVVCPGPVPTRMDDSARNRPVRLRNDPVQEAYRSAKYGAQEEEIRRMMATGMHPDELAGHVFDAIRSERFYVLPDPWVRAGLRAQAESIAGKGVPWFEPDFTRDDQGHTE